MNTILLSVFVLVILLTSLAALVAMLNAILITRKNVVLNINGARALNIVSGDKLLDYLLRNDIAIPSACAGAGTCGLCKVQVSSGGGEVSPTEQARLTQSEIDRGTRLSCQLSVRSDLSVTIPEDVLSAKSTKCRITSTRNVSPLIKEITIEQTNGEPFKFKPGDFVEVAAPAYTLPMSDIHIDEPYRDRWEKLKLSGLKAGSVAPVSRAYSIATRPVDQGRIVLLIRLALPPSNNEQLIPPGVVSSWLFSRKVNDELDLTGPFGHFHIRSDHRDIVLVGGGVGMAPLRAMAHSFVRTHESPTVYFYYGARSEEDLFYVDEFEQLEKHHTNFQWNAALSNTLPNSSWNGPVGFIHDSLNESFLNVHPHPEQCDYYLCGPPLMIQATKALLLDSGISDQHIFADDFGV